MSLALCPLARGLGAWVVGTVRGHLPETLGTHWRKQALEQHFIDEGHWRSFMHWSGVTLRQGPSSGGQPPNFSAREPSHHVTRGSSGLCNNH